MYFCIMSKFLLILGRLFEQDKKGYCAPTATGLPALHLTRYEYSTPASFTYKIQTLH